MKKIRVIAGGALAALSLFGVVACGSSGTQTPNIRKFTGLEVAGALAGPGSTTQNSNGSPAINAECQDDKVDPAGVGTYLCTTISYRDGTSSTNVEVKINSEGEVSKA